MSANRRRAAPDADSGAEAEHNPALEPPPPSPPTKKTYKVTGATEVHGTQPGKTFTATLPPQQEADLIWGGHITIEKEA